MKTETTKTILTGICICSFFLLMFGMELYWIGFHNVDLGQNVRYINAEHNLALTDTTNNFQTWDATTMYITGQNQQNIAIKIIMAACMLFGSSITLLSLTNTGEQK